MKKNTTFSSIYANYEQNLAISQGVHISNVNYAKVNHSPIVTSICGTSGTSCPNALANSFAFSSGSSLFLSGYSPHSSAYIPLSSAGFYYQFASACRSKGGKYLATGLMAASLLQGIMAPYALAFTSNVNDGETQTGLVLSAGDIQNVNNGGTASGTTMSGGEQNVNNGGTANDTIINATGRQWVSNGGTANDTTINDGGYQFLSRGGTANDTAINTGGKQYVSSGGTANSTNISSGTQNVWNSGIANDTIINEGGNQYVSSGLASGTTINNNGNQNVLGGTANNTTINDTGRQYVSNGGTANNTTINDTGRQYVSNGGTANDTTINGGEQNVRNGGTASGTTINGGEQNVYVGGTASGTTISGGTQFVYDGGTANDTTINDRGTQNVSFDATASGTTINGGEQNVYVGGTASGTTISGGTQNVLNGGTANITTVLNGGSQSVENGGTAISSIISTGGTLKITGGTVTSTFLHGGTIAGNVTYSAGQVLRAEGGSITGDVTFNGGTFVPVLGSGSTPVNVTGTVTGMAGGTIAPVWYNNQAGTGSASYTVLSATSLDATFGTETKLVKARYTQEISGNELLLHVTEQSAGFSTQYADYLTPNGQRLARVLDVVDANGQLPTLMTALGNLPADGEIVGAALRQLTPESFSTANALNHSIIRAFMAQIPSMAEGIIRVGENTKQLTASKTNGLPAGSEFKQNTWQFFGSPFGFTASQQSDGGYSGYDMTAAGVNLGIMRSFDNYWLGASLGYSNQYLKMKDINAKIDSDQLMFSVFGGVRHENFFAEAALGYAHTWNDSSRNVNIGTGVTAYYDELTANYGQDSFLASLTLGYVFEFDNNFRIIPSIGVDYVYTHSYGFEESGGDGALGSDANSFHSLQIPVSITFEKSFMVNEAIITPSLIVSWIPELGDVYATTNSHFVHAPSAGNFETRSIENARHTFAFGAGLDMQFSEDFGIDVNYELNTRSKYIDHSVDVNFKWEF